jgi:predicted nucleotidyltransferase component of viral defense system
MITKEQLKEISKKKKINEYTILREYLQLWFLSELYKEKFSENIFFKGGTAIHIVYGMDRFSEDLDFSVSDELTKFNKNISGFLRKLSKIENIDFKERRSILGKKFVLILNDKIIENKVFIDLDFSFREKVFKPESSIIKTDYPVIFTSFINHLSKEEIFAKKIRALLTREKGRDLYDLWFLLNKVTDLDLNLINKKISYYKKRVDFNEIIKAISKFDKKEFVKDLKPFVAINTRNDLEKIFDYIKAYLIKTFKELTR